MPDDIAFLIVVFDGLQPAQITPGVMPNLAQFVSSGTRFDNHHPVFPTVTRVNVASLVTGVLPGRHGIAGNTFLCRDFDPCKVIPAMKDTLTALGEKTGRVLLTPNLAEILGQHGKQYVAVGTGTSGNAFLHNPNAANAGGATIHPDFTLPVGLHTELEKRFGEWPEQSLPNSARLAHARKVLTNYILPELDPSVVLIWSSEPDKTQHEDGVGLGRAPAALGQADAEFGELLEYLESSGRAENTNVIVLSDHAYSTISEIVPIEAQLRDAGFPDISQPGGVAVAGNGGSVLFYVHNSDSRTSRQLTGWLETKPWCGAVFASRRMGEIEGTFPAALIGCDGPRSPDIAMSFLWNSESNAAGYPGYAPSTGGKVGQGQHGSASQHELRNVGLARGPSFRVAATVETPTGNVDVAPTILHLLGIEHGETPMDGRILFEALGSGVEELPAPTTEILRAGVGQFQQAIQLSRIGESIYIDWANRV